MEYNDYNFTPQADQRAMTLGEEDRQLIASSCKWAKFLSILGFISMGLMVVAVVLMMLGVLVAGSFFSDMMMGPFQITMFVVMMSLALVVSLLYFLPLFYLYNYASKGARAVEAGDTLMMTESFANLKRFFKFIGIMTIVVIALYLLMILVGVVIGVAGLGAMSDMYM